MRIKNKIAHLCDLALPLRQHNTTSDSIRECQTVIIIWLRITKTMLILDMKNTRLTKLLLSLTVSAIATTSVLAQESPTTPETPIETAPTETTPTQTTPTQTTPTQTTPTQTTPTEETDNVRSQPNIFLSLQGGEKLMTEASEAINNQQYDIAADKLQKARQVFNQLSNFYLQLFDNFSGIDNRIAESQRGKALETGQMRDEATYQLALVHRAQEQPELSVPLLVQVVNSQNPTSELGKKAYQQLYEIGFVDEPFTGSNAGQ